VLLEAIFVKDFDVKLLYGMIIVLPSHCVW